MITTLIFDLDGTLIETKQLHWAGLQAALFDQNPRYELSTKLKHQLEGLPTTVKLAHLESMGWNFNTSEVIKYKQQYVLTHLNNTVCPSGLPEKLKQLSENYKMCLATNARNRFTLAVLQRFSLDMFDIVLSTDYLGNKVKPDPFVYEECMRLTNSSPEQTVIFEDSEVGLAGASACGAQVELVYSSKDTLERIENYICKS